MKYNRCKWIIAKLAILALLAVADSMAQAGTIEVQVGYADNIRPSPFFPDPWDGGAGVSTFAGAGPSYDAGAIRIINNGATGVIFGGMTVSGFGDGSSVSIWGAYVGTVIPAGKSMILTQTASYNFDSSDFQGGGPASAVPKVSLTIDSVTTDFFDTAQVLNTEGTDHLAQAGLNESHQWRDIGTFGGQAAPETTGFSVLLLAGLGLVGFAKLGCRTEIA